MDNYSMTPISWCCPNCGEVTSAFLNGKGVARKVCAKCSTTVVMKPISRRHHRLEIYAPTDYLGEPYACSDDYEYLPSVV